MPLSFAEALERVQTLPTRFTLFYRTLRTFSSIANFVLRIAGILLAIYLVHQLFFWLSDDPEAAFDRGRFVVEVIELVWDLFTLLWNVAADVINSAILPLWNAVAFYIFEPAIVLVLEVFSLVFLRKKYEGFVNENDFAFGGFVCDSSSQVSETWCGRFGAYNKRLEVSGSETAENSITFGVATARRLSHRRHPHRSYRRVDTIRRLRGLRLFSPSTFGRRQRRLREICAASPARARQ